MRHISGKKVELMAHIEVLPVKRVTSTRIRWGTRLNCVACSTDSKRETLLTRLIERFPCKTEWFNKACPFNLSPNFSAKKAVKRSSSYKLMILTTKQIRGIYQLPFLHWALTAQNARRTRGLSLECDIHAWILAHLALARRARLLLKFTCLVGSIYSCELTEIFDNFKVVSVASHN